MKSKFLTDLDSDRWVGAGLFAGAAGRKGSSPPSPSPPRQRRGESNSRTWREEYPRSIEPAHALSSETLKLERTLCGLVNQACGLTPAEIALMWQTAPRRMPIRPPVAL